MTIPSISRASKLNRLNTALQGLVGQECVEIQYINYEEIPERLHKKRRPYLTYTPKHHSMDYVPIYHLPLIWLVFGVKNAHRWNYRLGIYGTWHILRNTKSLCAYIGALDSDGKLLENIHLLENFRVKRVVFIPEKLNLFIEFDKSYWLGVFHDVEVSSGFKIQCPGLSSWTLLNGEVTWEFVTS